MPEGRIRQQNEDSVLVDSTIFVVADGMGGHKAGEVASALTVQLLKRRLEPASTTISLDDVLAAVVEANNEIFQAATENVDHQGMGTTLTGLFVVRQPGHRRRPAHAEAARRTEGHVRAHQRRRLAHLPVPPRTPAPGHRRPQLRAGARQHRPHHRRRGRTHPRRNIVTRALGIDPSVRVDAWTLPIVRGDRFVVCSDGLSDEVHDTEIHQILTTGDDPQAAAEELVPRPIGTAVATTSR